MHRDELPGRFFGPATLVELLRHRARCQAEDVAFTILLDGESQTYDLTYQELDRRARAIGAWLQSQDLVGERALLVYPPGEEFIAAFFGCLYAGVIAVPVFPPRPNRSMNRIQAIARDADARLALTTQSVLQRVGRLIQETPDLSQLVWQPTCALPEGIEQQWDPPRIDGDTLAFLQYTSGSTGAPKGVMLSHANLVHNSALIAHAFEHTRSGSGVFWLPNYHDMGLIGGILQPMYVGRPNVLMSPMSFLQKPYRWLAAISRFRGTTSGGPNFAYDLCVRKITPEQRATLDLSCWRVAFNGAEPVWADTLREFSEAFAPCGFRPEAFYPCYGMAEATLIVSGGYVFEPPVIRHFDGEALGENRAVRVSPEHPLARALVGCGQNLPDQQIAIADPDTETRCPPGRIGEIWVSGPSVAQGYWRKKLASQATFRARLRDTGEGPFLRTGDLGFLDEGELFITGRIKDLIIIRGMNCYPQDIERTVQHCHPRLRAHSGAAFALEAKDGARLVVAQEGERHRHGGLKEICRAIRQAVAAEHDLQVDEILLLKAGSIPKTTSNKIQRNECRKRYLKGELTIVYRWPAPAPQRPAPTEAAAQAPPAALEQPLAGQVANPRPPNGNGASRSPRAADLKLPGM